MVIPITHREGVGQAYPDHNPPTTLETARRAALLNAIRSGYLALDLSRDGSNSLRRRLGMSWGQFYRLIDELTHAELIEIKLKGGTVVVASAVADRPAGGPP